LDADPPAHQVKFARRITGRTKLNSRTIQRNTRLQSGESHQRKNATAGLDPEKFAGHSLRRGLLTAGADNRANLTELMRQSRHRSAQSVLGYLEPADLRRNNVTEGVFRQKPGNGQGGGSDETDA